MIANSVHGMFKGQSYTFKMNSFAQMAELGQFAIAIDYQKENMKNVKLPIRNQFCS